MKTPENTRSILLEKKVSVRPGPHVNSPLDVTYPAPKIQLPMIGTIHYTKSAQAKDQSQLRLGFTWTEGNVVHPNLLQSQNEGRRLLPWQTVY